MNVEWMSNKEIKQVGKRISLYECQTLAFTHTNQTLLLLHHLTWYNNYNFMYSFYKSYTLIRIKFSYDSIMRMEYYERNGKNNKIEKQAYQLAAKG
jgi:hypothetical protein